MTADINALLREIDDALDAAGFKRAGYLRESIAKFLAADMVAVPKAKSVPEPPK